MKKILILILSVLSVVLVSAQQDPQFSQNMFNKLANNPGFAGSRGVIATSVLHRSQWMGFAEGGSAISTQNFSIDAELPFLYGGVGLNIVKDDIAQYSNLGLQASYAYRTELGVGQIGMGMSVGMFQSGVDGSAFNYAEPGDNAIPTSSINGSKLDIGAGIYYNTQDVYVGISSSHMTEPVVEWSDGTQYPLERHYFLIAGYYHQLNPVLSLNPSIYLKSDGASSQLDINSNLIYNNKIWGGVSYRNAEPVFRPELAILTGMHITEDLKIGLAYDIVFSGIGSNSIEFMLGYDFKIKQDKAISKHKNPRFL
jgi:type IX secretion system PorP/SprF family membrane protein